MLDLNPLVYQYCLIIVITSMLYNPMSYSNYKILGLVPARSGSKAIPNKNILSLAGKPMMAYSIEHSLKCRSINRTIVSTDSELYAGIASSFGAEVPFLRPAEYSGDLSTDLEVFIHCLEWLEKNENYRPDICVQLRPTHPVRNIDDIDKMVQIMIDDPSIDSVRSVVKSPDSPYKMWFANSDNTLRPVIDTDIRDAYNLPRQVLPETYLQNASIDVIRTDTIVKKRSMTGEKISGYIMDEIYDIDTFRDLSEVQNRIIQKDERISGKTFCFDIDGVISSLTPDNNYKSAQPIESNIDIINALYDMGNTIILFTARGTMTGIDWTEVTEGQMNDWKVKYHRLMFGKPAADYYIDDRLIAIEHLKSFIK